MVGRGSDDVGGWRGVEGGGRGGVVVNLTFKYLEFRTNKNIFAFYFKSKTLFKISFFYTLQELNYMYQKYYIYPKTFCFHCSWD